MALFFKVIFLTLNVICDMLPHACTGSELCNNALACSAVVWCLQSQHAVTGTLLAIALIMSECTLHMLQEVDPLYDMFYTRAMLHSRAYQHIIKCLIEEMWVKAMAWSFTAVSIISICSLCSGVRTSENISDRWRSSFNWAFPASSSHHNACCCHGNLSLCGQWSHYNK